MSAASDAEATNALRSVHTPSFPQLLNQAGISLAVSTYQAGKLILVRADGDTLNTHFRAFNKPMGMAATPNKMALGTAYQIVELRNVPAVTPRLEPPDKHDGCYLPRRIHLTGDIDIHEMAYAGEELWFANTRFSCLCTLDAEHSFVPRWRPPFVSAYDLSDRCHLNGIGIRDEQPRYATTLGETDTPGGWRENKAWGGTLIDTATDEVLCRGLSMPHSPRWYWERLWLLESGVGSLAQVNPTTGQRQTVTELPGFTRGLDFWGPWAFVGLSQVRESAVFGGLPITERAQERVCGVWVVDLRNGETVALLRFEEGVQEIFAVRVLPSLKFPELVNWDETLLGSAFVLPDGALQETVPPQHQASGAATPAPETAQGCLERGNRAYHRRTLQGAEREYRRSLELDPELLTARYNLGVVLLEREQWAEAQTVLEQVLEAQPNHPHAYNNLGLIAHRQNQLPQAIHYLRQAIALQPDFPDAHLNLAMTLLQAGEFEQGWQEWEWRWRTDQFQPFECPHPQWKGDPIRDKTLLVHTEQGAGDAIQFARYLPLVASQCGKLLLCCPPELMELFRTVERIDELFPPGEISQSAFDTYSPLMSLPRILGTTLETVPAQVPYLGKGLQPEQFPFPEAASGPKVGIAWAGSPTHRNDRNRSCPLAALLPLLRLPGVNFYSLQKGERAADLTQLPPEVNVTDLSPLIDDFADTARAMAHLDGVISVDTSVAHLAGALGKPVWTLLCYSPDWRWLLERDDTPWYPTMGLFRQPAPGDWASVVRAVVQAWERNPLQQDAVSGRSR